MSIIATFNGFNVISVPSSPGLRSVQFAMTDSIGETTSPFTLQSQFYQWAGADLLTGTASLPDMSSQVTAAPWVAFLGESRGKLNVFSLGDPERPVPNGSALSGGSAPEIDGTVSGGNTPGSTTLYTDLWKESTNGLLLPGDWIGVGYRLYLCLDTVDSDSNGKAQISIWPSIREEPTGGTALTLTNPTGLFRLADNKRQWAADYTRTTQISFQFVEAK